MSDPHLAQTNARIAEMYDYAPWIDGPMPWLKLDWLLGVSRLYGIGHNVKDVLDLGCGGGGAICHMGDQVDGRLVGVDISPVSCQVARDRMAGFGDRLTIHCADFLSLDPDSLGQFDLIYLIGVYYVTPPDVQRRLLALIRQCLRPGGLAVISYYTGPQAILRSAMHTTLKAIQTDSDSAATAVALARSNLKRFRDSLVPDPETSPLMISAIDALDSLEDAAFYHEVFNANFQAVQTADVHQQLAMGDVQFLTYITPSTASLPAEPMQRAVVAERNDYVAGGYEFALFGRSDQGLVPNPRAAGVIWTSSLTRIDLAVETNSQGTFGAANGIEVALNNPLTEAVLDALVESDLSWADAEARALATGMLIDETLIERSAQDAMELWRLGLIKPLAV